MPVLPAAAAAPLLIGSTAISAIGAIQQGNAQAAMANYQAQVQQNNAIMAGQYAQYQTQAGESQAYSEGLKQRQAQQAITSGIAAGGVDVNTGSAAAVRTSARELGMLDVEQVRQQAALQAYGSRVQQVGFQAESQLQTAEAGFSQTAGFLRAGGDLLTGGAGLSFLQANPVAPPGGVTDLGVFPGGGTAF